MCGNTIDCKHFMGAGQNTAAGGRKELEIREPSGLDIRNPKLSGRNPKKIRNKFEILPEDQKNGKSEN